MPRSIYCSTCKKEKEPGRENESRCKKCRSDARKENNKKKREAAGLPPWGSGRSLNCYSCGAVKENPSIGYCYSCKNTREQEWKLKTGRISKIRTGLCQCGKEMASYSKCYCKDCATAQRKKWLDRNPDKKKQIQDRSTARRKESYVSRSKGRVRKKGTLINGVPVICPACDKLTEGWCERCDYIYWLRKEQYSFDDEYALKVRTRALTRSYIANGLLAKLPCEVCQTTKSVQAHHDDYSDPLNVRWLCVAHHAEHHKKLKTVNKDINHVSQHSNC